MDQEAVVLRRELSRVAKGRGRRYPRQLQVRVAAWAMKRHQAGASWEAIKRELGQKYDTIRRWCAVEAKSAPVRALVPVRVVQEHEPVRCVHVVSPNGFRIESLSISEAMTVLRELG